MYLKSNMDRFIDALSTINLKYCFYLKSNMDRFIEIRFEPHPRQLQDLKSNMDRFIVDKSSKILLVTSI